MFRIGAMIRSAKMKATTPPKLMPPFQSTTASGTFPIEHTNEMMATTGPTSGPHTFDGTDGAHLPWAQADMIPPSGM
jgi:hypothetical protein